MAQTGPQGNWCPRGLLLWQAGAWGLMGVTQRFRQRAMAQRAAVQGRWQTGENPAVIYRMSLKPRVP